jgi:hypothetical protein
METSFSIFSALTKIVYENIEIINKYGFPSYLRESNDVYFLVESLSSGSSYVPNSYAKNLIILDEIKYEGAFNNMCIDLCYNNPSDVKKYVEAMSPEISREFIQNAIFANEIGKDNAVVKETLRAFNVKGLTYRLEKIPYRLEKEGWVECEEVEAEPVIEFENPYGYSGLYNDEAFCIKKHIEQSEITDTRVTTTGRGCPKSWHIDELTNIAIELKIPYEDNSSKFKGIKSMERDDILENLKATKAKTIIKEYADLDLDDLRRALYFFSSRKEVSCSAIRKWMEENGVIQYDENCGKSGAKKLKIH